MNSYFKKQINIDHLFTEDDSDNGVDIYGSFCNYLVGLERILSNEFGIDVEISEGDGGTSHDLDNETFDSVFDTIHSFYHDMDWVVYIDPT